jgi:hypothetical protein
MDLKQLYKNVITGESILLDPKESTMCPYSEIFTPLTDWVVTHNNDTMLIVMQVFVNDILVDPDEVVINDGNTFTVKFGVPTAGRVNFLVYNGIGGNGCGVVD